MEVFISWSGERSRAAASALANWLPLILQQVRPWLSHRDIAAGQRWGVEVGRHLDTSDFGVIVLTAENLTAPWILFEAGALSKAFTEAGVCPYLIDLDYKEIGEPLSQFQAAKADAESTLRLVESINSRATEPVDRERLRSLFEALWPRLEESLSNLPKPQDEPRTRPESQVLEDIVGTVRHIEAVVERIPTGEDDRTKEQRQDVVRLRVDGNFKRLINGSIIYFKPSSDLAEDVAAIAELGLEEMGEKWFLRLEGSAYSFDRIDARHHAKRAQTMGASLVVSDRETQS